MGLFGKCRSFLTTGLTFCILAPALISQVQSQDGPPPKRVVAPATWDDKAMNGVEVPLANPIGSPKHVSADYYYRIPVRPVYQQYPVYAPGREPAGYLEELKRKEPVIIWDGAAHTPALRTDQDWIRAGEMVFGAAITFRRIRVYTHSVTSGARRGTGKAECR